MIFYFDTNLLELITVFCYEFYETLVIIVNNNNIQMEKNVLNLTKITVGILDH